MKISIVLFGKQRYQKERIFYNGDEKIFAINFLKLKRRLQMESVQGMSMEGKVHSYKQN